MHIYTYI